MMGMRGIGVGRQGIGVGNVVRIRRILMGMLGISVECRELGCECGEYI